MNFSCPKSFMSHNMLLLEYLLSFWFGVGRRAMIFLAFTTLGSTTLRWM